MRVRRLSPEGDYTFGNGQLDFYRDEPLAVGQVIKTSLLLWLGEWFLDVTLGVPYLQGIIGKHGQNTADVTVQDQILPVQGVVDIESFQSTLDPQTRGYSVSAKVNTIYGVTAVEIANYGNF